MRVVSGAVFGAVAAPYDIVEPIHTSYKKGGIGKVVEDQVENAPPVTSLRREKEAAARGDVPGAVAEGLTFGLQTLLMAVGLGRAIEKPKAGTPRSKAAPALATAGGGSISSVALSVPDLLTGGLLDILGGTSAASSGGGRRRRDDDGAATTAPTVTVRAEQTYMGAKKHGLDWTEGAAEAKKGKPQGQWGSVEDLDWASARAATLKPGEGRLFSYRRATRASFGLSRASGSRQPTYISGAIPVA